MGYPTQAQVAVYDFNAMTMTLHWYDTYRQAVKFTKSLGENKKIVVGTINIVEVAR
jgi:hypothetical protein